MIRYVGIWLLMLTVLTSCAFPEEEIADDIEMVTVFGFDKGDGGDLLTTLSVPFFQSNTEVINKIYHTTSHFTKDALDQGSSKSENPMVLGQAEVVLFGKELGEKGLMKYLDTFQRDPSISTRLYIALAENKSSDILNDEYPTNTDNGVVLGRMFKQNMKKNLLPQTNLHVFLMDYYQEGQDPFLPIVTKEEDLYRIKGLAMFDGAVYKGSIDYLYATMVFRQLKESFSHGSFTFDAGDDYASIQNIISKKKVKVTHLSSKPTIQITVNIKGYLREYSGPALTKSEMKKITSQLEKDTEKQAMELIDSFKEWNVDPLGLGNEIKKRKRDWEPQEWKPIYPKVDVKVDVHAKIEETGVTS